MSKMIRKSSRFKSLRGLFRKRSRWIQGCYARDANGKLCKAFSPRAESFCLVGATMHVYKPSYQDGVRMRLSGFTGMPVNFNDHPFRSFKDIQRVVRQAKV